MICISCPIRKKHLIRRQIKTDVLLKGLKDYMKLIETEMCIHSFKIDHEEKDF